MFVVKNKVDLLKHPSFEPDEAAKGEDSGLPIPRRNTPQLLLNFS
jgi:hypothetical protein